MFRKSKDLLLKYDASFMISGEVVGQRPMSQRIDAMNQVAKLSEADDLILRPLSAKLLPITSIEESGMVNRELLLDISGRSRKRQLALASEIGLENFEAPAGGCLLTEERFSEKLRDFVKYEKLNVTDITLLKVGRHLRLPDGAKLVVGRHKEDNAIIDDVSMKRYYKAKLIDLVGPISLISKDATESDLKLATKIIVTYAKSIDNNIYSVNYGDFTLESNRFDSKDYIKEYFI